jgi:hypothetical protein
MLLSLKVNKNCVILIGYAFLFSNQEFSIVIKSVRMIYYIIILTQSAKTFSKFAVYIL